MAEGQNIGGVYVSIGADLTNLQRALTAATDVLSKLQKQIEGIKVRFDDTGAKKAISTMKELAGVTEKVKSSLEATTAAIAQDIKNIGVAIQSATKQVTAFGSSYEQAMKNVEGVLNRINAIQKSNIWETASAEQRAAVIKLKEQVEALYATLRKGNVELLQQAKLSEALKLPEAGVLLKPLEAFGVELNTITKQAISLDTQLANMSKKELAVTQLKNMNAEIQTMNASATTQNNLWIRARDTLLDMSTVLRFKEGGQWQLIDEEQVKESEKILKDMIATSSSIDDALAKTAQHLENTYGVPARKRFVEMDNQISALLGNLLQLAQTEGLTKRQQAAIDRRIKSLSDVALVTEDLTLKTVELDQQSLDIDLKRFVTSTEAGKDAVTKMNESLSSSAQEVERLTKDAALLQRELGSRETEGIVMALGLTQKDMGDALDWMSEFKRTWDRFWNNLEGKAETAGGEVKKATKDIFTIAAGELEPIDISQIAPDPDILRQNIEAPLLQSQQAVEKLRLRFVAIKEAMDAYITPTQKSQLTAYEKQLVSMEGALKNLRESFTQGKIDVKEFTKVGIGTEFAGKLQVFANEFDQLIRKTREWQQALGLITMGEQLDFSGPIQRLGELSELFRSRAVTIGNSWSAMKDLIKTSTDEVNKKIAEFRDVTKSIPDIGLPGFEEFVKIHSDLDQLSESVKNNAQTWHDWNEELLRVTRQSPVQWAKSLTTELQAQQQGVRKNSDEWRELQKRIDELSTTKGAERAYNERINLIRQHMEALQTTLNQELAMYKEHTAQVESEYRKLALASARLMTKELKFEPMQVGLEVTEFQQEALTKTAGAVHDLKIRLEELNAQETLNIGTEKSRAAQLTTLNQIVEKAVPLNRVQVEEMVRLGLSVEKAKIRFDALETVMNKLSQISSSRIIYAEQFSAATQHMRLFEDKIKSVSSILGSLGVGFDDSSARIVDKFEQMDNIVIRARDDIAALRAAFSNVNLVLQQSRAGIGVSTDTFKAMQTSLKALPDDIRAVVQNLINLSNLKKPEYLQRLADQLGVLINDRVKPAQQEISKLYKETQRELFLGKAVEEAADRIPKLKQRLEELTLQQATGTVTQQNLNEKMRIYQQLIASGEGLSTRQVRDLKNVEEAMRSLSAQSKNVADVQLSQSTLKLKDVGDEYTVLTAKMSSFKQQMDNLVSSLAIYSEQAVKQTTRERQIVTSINERIQRVNQLKQVYDTITSVIVKMQAAEQEGIEIDSEQFRVTREEIVKLVEVLERFTGIKIDPDKLKDIGISQLVQNFRQGRTQIGQSIDGIRQKLSELSREGQQELAIGIEAGKAASQMDEMRSRLTMLIESQNRGVLSLESLTEQLKIYQALMAQGVLSEDEIVRMNRLIQTMDLLKQKLIDVEKIQKELATSTAAQESLGRSYDALTGRINTYKKSIQDVATTLANLGVRTVEQTQTEKLWSQTFQNTTAAVNQFIVSLQNLEKARQKLDAIQQLKIEGRLQEARRVANELNKELEVLGLGKLSPTFNLDDLKRVRVEFDNIETEAKANIDGIVTHAQQRFQELKPQIEIEGLDAKRAQELDELTDKITKYGEQEKRGMDITAARTQRVQALHKALQLTQVPQQQAVRFLEDQIVLEKQHITQIEKEIAKKPYHIGLITRHAIEQNKLNRLQHLFGQVSRASEAPLEEQARLFKEVDKYAQFLSRNVAKLQGRYKGFQQAVNTFVGDIKNLIAVQIRWYTTQALIFRTVGAIQEAFRFYADLEVQISRVTSAIADQYDVQKTQLEITRAVREEMVRTGKAAEELATILWELVSAGLSHQEAMAGIQHVTNLAVGAELELSEATRISAGLFRVFGEEVERTGDSSDKWRYIMDRLAATLNQSQVDMNGLIAGLGYLINEADAAGLQFEQVLGILSVLNNRLLLGSKAGRSASRVLTQLTANAKELSKAFSIDIDFTGPLDLEELLTKLNKALTDSMVNGELTVETFDKLQDVFGQVGKRAAVGLILNLDELNKTVADLKTDRFDDLAEKMAAIKIEPLAIQIDRLSNRLKLLFADAMSPFIAVVDFLIRRLNDLGDLLGNVLSDDISKLVVQFISIIGTVKILTTLLKWRGVISSSRIFLTIGRFAKQLVLTLKTLTTTTVGLTTATKQAAATQTAFSAYLNRTNAAAAATIPTMVKLNLAMSLLGFGIVAAGFGIIKLIGYFQGLKDALKDSTLAAREARQEYADLISQIDSEQSQLEELITTYKESIPYSQEWFGLRERIKSQYPGYLGLIDREIQVTGDATEAVQRLVIERRRELDVLQKLEDIRKKDNEQAEEGAKTIKAISGVLFAFIPQLRTQVKFISSYARGTAELSENIQHVSEAVIDMVRNGKEVPPQMNLIIESLKGIGTGAESVFEVIHALQAMEDTGGVVSEELAKVLEEAKNILGDVPELEIPMHMQLDTAQVREILAAIGQRVQEVTQETFGDISFDEILDEYIHFITVFRRDADKLDAPRQVLERFNTFLADFSGNIPEELQAMLERTGASLEQVVDKTREAYAVQLAGARTEAQRTIIELNIMKEALAEFQPVFGQAVNVHFVRTMRTMRDAFRGVRIDAVGDIQYLKAQLALLYQGLSAPLKKELQDLLGKQSDEFMDFITTNRRLTEDEFEKMVAVFAKIAENVDANLDAPIKRMLEGLGDLTDRAKQTEKAFDSLLGAISVIGAQGTTTIERYLEANEHVIEQALEALPDHAQKMIRRTSALERIELIKMIKDTLNAAQEEIGKFGVPLTPELKAEVTVRKFREMYQKMSTIEKQFYDEERKRQDDNIKKLQQDLDKLATIRAETATDNLELIRKERALELQYEQDLLEIRLKKESIRALGIEGDERREFTELTESVKNYDRALQKMEEQILQTEQAMEVLSNATTRFSSVTTGRGAESLRVILTRYTSELEALYTSQSEEISYAFTNFVESLGQQEQAYIRKFLDLVTIYTGGNVETAQLIIKDLLGSLLKTGEKSFDDATGVLEKKLGEQQSRLNIQLQEATNQRLVAEYKAQEILGQVDNKKIESLTEYRLLDLQERQIHLKQQEEIYKLQEEQEKRHLKRLEAVRKKALDEVKDYMAAYQEVMSPEEFLSSLETRVDLEAQLLKGQQETIDSQLTIYNRQLALTEKRYEAHKTKMRLISEDLPGLAPEIDQVKATYESLRAELDNQLTGLRLEIERKNKQITETGGFIADVGGSKALVKPGTDLGKQLYGDLVQTASDLQKQLDELKDKEQKAIKALQADQKIAADIILQGLESEIKMLEELIGASTEQLKKFGVTSSAEFAQIAKNATESVNRYMQSFLQAQDPILSAEVFIGEFDESVLTEFGEDFESGMNRIRESLTATWAKFLDQIFKEGTEDVEKRKEFEEAFKRVLDRITTNAFIDMEKKIQEKANKAIREGLGDIGKTGPIISLEMDLAGLHLAEVDVNKLLELRQQLGQEERGRVATLKEQLEAQIELNRLSLEEEPRLKKAYQDAQKRFDAVDKELKVLIKRKETLGEDEDLLDKINKKTTERSTAEDELNKAAAKVNKNQKDYENTLENIVSLHNELVAIIEHTGTVGQKVFLGLGRSIRNFIDEATDVIKITEELTTTVLEGFATAIKDTMSAIFIGPEQEIENIRGQLRELEEEKAAISKRMRLIEVGRVLPEELEEYRELQEQWKEINDELREANDQLNEMESIEKRVGEAFKKFAQTILDALADVIARLIVVNLLTAAIGGLGDLFSGSGSKWRGIFGGPAGTIGIAKGGIVEGGFAPMSADQMSFLKALKATFFQGGGVASGPVLGVIGEGGRSEAVVPLPDNRHIPVQFVGDEGPGKDVQILNLIDPEMIPSIMLQYPDAVLNIVNQDIVKRGPIFQAIKSIK